ncbi:hypothetical protein PTTG_26786 [Puccinia triticina 1-1 BBBD Race 1]|uniref:Uncharacterized protein n=2 Tax=Puccinia triticina TaxID=208348 RepID=A0A180GRX5_PUCT1|nr:uncharacterized protein PtA15_16A56 [Puccinia triticina]OAV95032.1 hypothetical protein PTTG_26786 [Puccinia triticina 1-1 BBBD Race 1]WAQ92150.1 hypothetical protein PtA15_16A56 [Puccinia triticina]WAR63891.1 hypothetical protein PtB15_16B50 [Puccinia triticina]
MYSNSIRTGLSAFLLLLILGQSFSRPLSDLKRRADVLGTGITFTRKTSQFSHPRPFRQSLTSSSGDTNDN